MKNIFIVFIIFFCSNCKIEAQQKITVSAFYSDYVAKYDKLPDSTWSLSQYVQVRIEHEFPKKSRISDYRFKNTHITADLAANFVFSSIILETSKGKFFPKL